MLDAVRTLRLDASHAAAAFDVATRAIRQTQGSPYTALQVGAWLEGLDRPRFRERLTETVAFGAFEGDEMLGFATFSESTRELEYLYVDPVHQGRGVGRRLVEEVERHARAAGVPEIRVDASALARPMLEALGYEVVSEYRKELRGAVFDNTWLRKRL